MKAWAAWSTKHNQFLENEGYIKYIFSDEKLAKDWINQCQSPFVKLIPVTITIQQNEVFSS